jgi:hypothetical protein
MTSDRALTMLGWDRPPAADTEPDTPPPPTTAAPVEPDEWLQGLSASFGAPTPRPGNTGKAPAPSTEPILSLDASETPPTPAVETKLQKCK